MPGDRPVPLIKPARDARWLFIGDSITDVGRKADVLDGLGRGYVRLIRDWLASQDAVNAPLIVNRGISGNKITDLSERWERDVIASDPQMLSIMVGVNDVWHGLVPDWRPGVALEDFVSIYQDLLKRTRMSLPRCKVVLCEPTVIEPAREPAGNEQLKPYVAAVSALTEEFKDIVVAVAPMHRAFLDAIAARPDIDWTDDGVHPTSAGHMLIARTWLTAINIL